MKRSQLVFVTAVFTALLTGILVERSGRTDPSLRFAFNAPRHVPFEDLEPPTGIQGVQGFVELPDGARVPGVTVHLSRTGLAPGVAEPLYATVSRADGSFHFEGLTEGSYELVLIEPGHEIARLEVRVPGEGPVVARLGPELGEIDALPPLRRSSFEGRLMPPVGFTREDTPLEGYEVSLVPAEDVSPLSGAIARTLAVDEGGFFRVDDLVEADYDVRVLPRWASGGSWPVLDETTFVHGSDAGTDVSLTLRLRCGEVQGRVTDVDQDPVQGALVQVAPLGDETHLWPPVQTNENGWFRVADLLPGSYQVQVQAGAAQRTQGVLVPIGGRPFLRFSGLDPRGSH